ncbi:MAG: AI-2E family transporter [Candidatus Syntropharchaeales archaeon]
MQEKSNHDRIFYIICGVVLLLAFLLLLRAISPLFDGIILGVVFAYVARPIKRKLAVLGGVLSSAIATLCIIIPIVLIVILGISEAIRQLIWLSLKQEEILSKTLGLLGSDLVPADITNMIYQRLPEILDYVTPILHSIISIETTINMGILLLNVFVLIVVAYYLLADGSKIVTAILKLVPLGKEDAALQYIREVDDIIAGIYVGNFFVALLIGLLSVPFLFAFKVPMVALIASLVFLAALVPLLAKWMIWVPISIYLFYTSGIYPAIAFFILVLIFIDVAPEFFIRPKLIGLTSKIHPLLLLLAFIGGGITGGIAGFFGAPVLVGILVGSYNVYTMSEKEDETEV